MLMRPGTSCSISTPISQESSNMQCGSCGTWSVLRMTKCLRAGLVHRHVAGCGCRRGQIAVSFIVIVALILLLSSFLMNLGEVGRLKTAASNAADAGALAAASWVVSGENALAAIAKAQWIIYLIVQVLFFFPWCTEMLGTAGALFLSLVSTNFGNLYKQTAEPLLDDTWDAAKKAALFTALANAAIDDPSETVSHDIKTLFESGSPLSDTISKTFHWTRRGANGQARDSSVTVNVHMKNQPTYEMSKWGPLLLWWTPFCVTDYCCYKTIGWHDVKGVSYSVPVLGTWTAGIPIPGTCDDKTCFIIGLLIGNGLVVPGNLSHGDGNIKVEVIRRREGGNNLGFWKMAYPIVTSKSTVHYNASDMSMWPSARSKSILTGVQ